MPPKSRKTTSKVGGRTTTKSSKEEQDEIPDTSDNSYPSSASHAKNNQPLECNDAHRKKPTPDKSDNELSGLSTESQATPLLDESGSNVNKKSSIKSVQDRLFNLRMKINQGRKANKAEVEEEYKRFSDPKYERKQRYIAARDAAAEAEVAQPFQTNREAIAVGTTVNSISQRGGTKDLDLMQQSAEQAERAQERAEEKERNAATFGWHAFTTDATHRAYEKRLKKLPIRTAGSKSSSSTPSTANDLDIVLDYGKAGSSVSAAGLERLNKDIEEREDARKKHSKRRMALDATDVNYINDRNAAYNKKLKRAFDKYTVEIRQNLERGTAV